MTIFSCEWKSYAKGDSPTASWRVKEWKSFSKKWPSKTLVEACEHLSSGIGSC
jgi:hypothetical protein